jgi:flagellar basal body-associated protein FliL
MSEAAAPVEGAKKKSKLPIIIALVAVLGGGGFFMMKGKGAKKEKPAVKLGPISDIKDEFLVNLRDNNGVYLRATVSLQFADGTKAEEVEKSMPAIEDLINARLRTKSVAEIKTLEGTQTLKREIATDVNAILSEDKSKDKEADKSDKSDSSDKSDKSDKSDEKSKDSEKGKKESKVPEGWDSAEGPVLKVLFRSFAWQSGS